MTGHINRLYRTAITKRRPTLYLPFEMKQGGKIKVWAFLWNERGRAKRWCVWTPPELGTPAPHVLTRRWVEGIMYVCMHCTLPHRQHAATHHPHACVHTRALPTCEGNFEYVQEMEIHLSVQEFDMCSSGAQWAATIGVGGQPSSHPHI